MRGEVKRAPAVTVERVPMTAKERHDRLASLAMFHWNEAKKAERLGDSKRAAQHQHLGDRCGRMMRDCA